MTIREYENFIDGRWTSDNAGPSIDVIDPATEEVVGRVLDGGAKQAVMAIEAARRAFDEGPWPWMSVRDRAKILKRFSEIMESRHADLRELIVSEIGSTSFLTDFLQVGGAIEASHYYSDFVEHDVTWVETPSGPTVSPTGLGGTVVVREPVGVVGVITPFNFPFSINLQKCLPALAVGCTVVLKPHPWTPMNALELARIADEAGIPPGVFNVVVGGGDVGEELSTNPLVDMIAFTGSTATGKRIREVSARTMKRAQLELGGKSAHIVLDDVTESEVAGIGFGQVLMHSGQACVAASRLLLPEHLLDPYIDGVKAMAPNLTIGDPRDQATVVGPLIREQQRQRVESYVQSALDEGATLVVGGKRPSHLSKGFFYEPTAFVNCRNDMRICPGRSLRPRSDRPDIQESGGGGTDCQRLRLRTRRCRNDAQRGARLQRGSPNPHRHNHCADHRGWGGGSWSQSGQRCGSGLVRARAWTFQRGRPVRWFQAQRPWPRAGAVGLRGVHRDQVDLLDVRQRCTRASDLRG